MNRTPRVIGFRKDGRPIYEIMGGAPEELVNVPQDLTLLSNDDLADFEVRAVAEFDRMQGDQNITPEGLQYQIKLAGDIDRIRAEKAGREVRAREEAARLNDDLVRQRATLEARVHGTEGPAAGNGGDGGTPAAVDPADIARAAAEGATSALVAVLGERRGIDVAAVTQRATASLSSARRHAPPVQVTERRLAVTAGVDIPGVARGEGLGSLDEIVGAFTRTAKSMPVTRDGQGQERLVASIRNEFEHTVDDRTSPGQMDELLRYMLSEDKQQALVAGGGWCAPSEIRYEFFNAADVDGLVDLPTVGINRGGMRFPVSPSIADAFGSNGLAPYAVAFSNASDPWLWTESDDISAATGTSPRKTTLRVACPSFSEARLECYGITLTAGNLTDDAYPEATAHTLSLLVTAHAHAMNARYISQMVTLSGAAITIGATGTAPVYQTVLNGLALGATDYRMKYAINDTTVVEVVAPYWLKDVIRADLAWREFGGTEMLSVTDAMIDGFFSDRQVRVQWVNDYQVRGAGQFGNASSALTAWPLSVNVLMYAAGTFVKGNGLTLDLGVVRDSTLNATNDYTAAWSEECHLIARVGNESRQYTLQFGVNGTTGFGKYAAGSPAAQI